MTENNSYNRTICIKLVGLSDEDKVKLESVFSFAESRLDTPWQFVTAVKADFYLLSHRLRSQMNQNDLLRSLPRKRCIFYVAEETDSDEHELVVGSENLPSLRSLVTLFNHLAATMDVADLKVAESLASAPPADASFKVEIQGVADTEQPISKPKIIRYIPSSSPVVEANISSPTTTSNTVYFDLDTGFSGLLLSKKVGIYRLELETNNKAAKLYINFDEQVYYSQDKLEQLEPFFSTEQVSSKPVLESLFQQDILDKGLKPLPLKNLVWFAVFSCSQGRVRKGYQKSDIVHLRRWPDINLPGCRELIKLAAYMQSNAVELSLTQEKTGFSMQQIYNFYNACYAIGLIEHVQQTDIFEKKLSDDNRQLFSKIAKRLNQAK